MYSNMEIGEVLRKLRMNKGYSIAQLCQNDMDSSFLSKVERGVSGIGADKFLLILDRLHVDLDEFLFALKDNNYTKDYEMRVKAMPFIEKKDSKGLEAIVKQSEKENLPFFTRLFLISWLSFYKEENLPENYKNELLDHLFTVDQWGNYEFHLFSVAIIALDAETLLTYGRIMMKRKSYFKRNEELEKLFLDICNNIIQICLKHKELSLAEYFISELENFALNEWYGTHRLLLKFYRSYLNWQKEKKEIFLEECKNYIAIANDLGMKNISFNLQEDLTTPQFRAYMPYNKKNE